MYANTAMTESCYDKKLKICVLKGSPNKDGITEGILKNFVKNFPMAQTEVFNAYALGAKPCTDCKFCGRKFGCSSKDLDAFFESYESCDVFVAAYPIYFLSLPSPMKSILDRFQKYFSARFNLNIKRPVEKERIGVLISSCGSKDETGFSLTLKQWKMAFSVSGIKQVESVFLSDTDSEACAKESCLPQIENAVQQIIRFTERMK